MPSTSSQILRCCLLFGCGFFGSNAAHADMLIAAKAISVPGVRLQMVDARLADDSAGGVHLQLKARQADVAAMGWRHVGLNLDGTLSRDERQRWVLDADVHLVGAPGGALGNAHVTVTLSDAANTLLVELLQGKAQANIALPLDQPTHAQIDLTAVPVAWLQGPLGTVWSGHATGGRLDAKLALDLRENGVESSGQFSFDKAGFDTPSGSLAGQGTSGSGRFTLDTTTTPAELDLDGSLRGGELLLGPIYARLPDHPVQLGLHANLRDGAFDFSRLHVGDADALQLDGSLGFDARGNLKTLQLDRLHAVFPAAYQRYGSAWLESLGLHDVHIAGQVNGSVNLRADGLRSFAFDTEGLNLSDGDGHVAIDGLHGGLDWSLQGDRPVTTLGWHSLQLYRIPNGAMQSRWQSRSGVLGLQQPVQMPLLDGHLRVGALDWRPAAAKGQRLATSLVLTGVNMAAFSKAVGWPAFPGTLGGAIPSLRWVDDRLELDGGLSANVFDGFVDITRLTLQHPFGPSPSLSADVALKQLDLGAITSVFDFGSITGRMDGSIANLQLADWSPVAFDASLLAAGGGRISQRAVNNLTSVGGGGIASGLQGAVLKLFKTFGYSRIGLNCHLQGAVCKMGGLDSNNGGYTIVEGSGLPHLRVIGHQTEVDWPTLVRRLREAVDGAAPQIR
jgi:hypothetical protein